MRPWEREAPSSRTLIRPIRPINPPPRPTVWRSRPRLRSSTTRPPAPHPKRPNGAAIP